MRNATIHYVLVFAYITILIVACTSNAADSEKDKQPVPAPAPLPVDVVVVAAKQADDAEVLPGSIVPYREVTIMSELSKKVVAVAFKDGSQVAAGQLLYKLNDADIRARIRQLQADLRLAAINESRLKALLQTEAVRQEEYDAALAKLQTLKATEDLLQVELSKTSIRAPFSGRAGISKVQIGALVSPGLPLVSLQEQGTVKIQFTVSERYLPLVRPGSKIQFSTALTERTDATVFASEPSLDQASRDITVQAVASNAAGKLRPGMSAKVFFKTAAETEKRVVLPTQALIPGGNGYNVFVVKGGVAKMTPVTIGNRDEDEATIQSGLQNGDTVMISNILRAMNGTPVSIITKK